MASVYPETVSVADGRRAARAKAAGATWGLGAAARGRRRGSVRRPRVKELLVRNEAAPPPTSFTSAGRTDCCPRSRTASRRRRCTTSRSRPGPSCSVTPRSACNVSALAGTAAVAVAYLIGVEVAGRRVGLITGALTALNPALIWYSQEARSYELFVLLAGLTGLFFLRARRRA